LIETTTGSRDYALRHSSMQQLVALFDRTLAHKKQRNAVSETAFIHSYLSLFFCRWRLPALH
jgi:hypothetical protein